MPVITRITNPDNYEQAVLKYMAQTNCDRVEAQGNMVSLYGDITTCVLNLKISTLIGLLTSICKQYEPLNKMIQYK